MNRRTGLWLVGALDVAMLVATSSSTWSTSDEADLGLVTLSAEAPDLALDPVIEVGDGVGQFVSTVSVELDGENLGGEGWLLLYVLPEPWSEGVALPDSPVATFHLEDGTAFETILGIEFGSADDLADLHLLLRLEGEAVVEATGALVVSAESANSPREDLDGTISVSLP